MLVDYTDTQDEMDKLAFTLDRNKFTRSSSFTAGQTSDQIDGKLEVSVLGLLLLFRNFLSAVRQILSPVSGDRKRTFASVFNPKDSVTFTGQIFMSRQLEQ